MLWPSEGETVAVFARWRGDRQALLKGLPDRASLLGGPALCVVSCTRVRWGRRDRIELRVLVPVLVRSVRVRWWPVLRVVDGGDGGDGLAGLNGRQQTLSWSVERDRRGTRVIRWVDQDVTIRARPGRLSVPVAMRWGRMARGEISAPVRSRLAPLAGRHRALVVGARSPVSQAPASASLSVRRITKPALGSPNPALAVAVDPESPGHERAEHALVSNVLVLTGA